MPSDRKPSLILPVAVTIERFTEDYPPGIVECSIQEADGGKSLFQIKQVYASERDLWWDSEYQQPGLVDCIIIERRGSAVRIEIEPPSLPADREYTVSESLIVWPPD